ncbi:unnamed protein product [Arctia plantaginis]|uniref:Uncharacterized protein n=1 Tax=Arctia plantaginis TaxID=874455 RepID=A0A8S1A1C8_ARCPL|nr:unnamed protein product [Arctia plantaginis]
MCKFHSNRALSPSIVRLEFVKMYWIPIVLVAAAACAQAQQTALSRVPDDLAECYSDPNLLNRNNLPPATIQVLIDIIRQIEDNPNVNMDLRQLSAVLLHTYRQDGIEFHMNQNSFASTMVLPFSPTGHSFHRHRLLLTRLIPRNFASLANDTLPSQLKCAIHHMLSTTVDMRLRGDESNCNQLSQYRSLRSGRSISDDVEIIKPMMKTDPSGAMQNHNPNDDVEYSSFSDTMSERQQLSQSTCPLLGGVVNTQWGAVSAGTVIAGIAAGASPQVVPIMNLVRDSDLNYKNVPQNVNNLFPATLSGDLAEAVLIQGTERGNSIISVGTAGNWNSSQATRFFMLHNYVNVEMTDPEIRGGIDGFVLGSLMPSILANSGNLPLSTLLDMYYSPVNGLLTDPSIRACNRGNLAQTNIPNLQAETLAFAAALDTNMALRGTIISGLDALVQSAVANFQTYTANNLNDMNCVTTLTVSRDFRTRTRLYIAMDATWPYQAVYPAISFLLDEIEVNKFGSNVTLLSAFDGSIIINTTGSIAEFHANYTAARHASILTGVNLLTSLTNIRQLMQEQLDLERINNYVGGASTVLLYMINSGNLQNNQAVWEQARLLNETVPDLRILFATSSNQQETIWNLVRDMSNDIHTVSLNTGGLNADVVMRPVLDRIFSAGRRIINPQCGSNFDGGSSGSRHFNDNVEPGYINFYSIHPNYFYLTSENRRIRINRSGGGPGTLTVCHSRVIEHPRQNITQIGEDANAVTCQTLATTGNVDINLENACDNYWTINTCPPFYISVQSNAALTAASAVACTDANCRFPYNIPYQVQIEELGCFSGANSVTASFLIILTALYFTLIKN